MPELALFMNGERVGVWRISRAGQHLFEYENSWRGSWNSRSLSLSLPISAKAPFSGELVAHFFENLLPDNPLILQRIQSRYQAKSVSAFDLLEAVGKECVGAIQILPIDAEKPDVERLEYTLLNETEIAAHLDGVFRADKNLQNQTDYEDFRFSLAGAQEKTALLRINNQWAIPKNATPTTHILKLPMGIVGGQALDFSHSVENEWLCMQILSALNIPVARTEIAQFGAHKVLVVERFDRRFMGNNTWIARLPQEDFCQIFGVSPNQKYESDGGPGIFDCLKVLKNSAKPQTDSKNFLAAQLAFWLLAATDGHAKNFSIFIEAHDKYRLTPLYDVLSIFPLIGGGKGQIPAEKARLAMAIRSKNAHYRLQEIKARHFQKLAEKSGVEEAWQHLRTIAYSMPKAIKTVENNLPVDFPEEVAEAIFSGVKKQLAIFNANVNEKAD